MAFFSEMVAAKLAGRAVGASLLVFMDFEGAPRRWTPGFGTLIAGGHTWQGTGELISISGIDQAIGTSAPKASFILSGVDPVITGLVSEAASRVKGRDVIAYLQFFDVTPDDAGTEPWTPLDDPYAVWSGIMDQLSYTASGPSDRTITLTAESLWTGRRKPPFGFYSDMDQKGRFPGDRGLEQVADLASKTVRWPVF